MEKVASAAADWFVRYLGSPLSNQEPDLATRDTRNASRRPFELTPCLTQRGARLISSASVLADAALLELRRASTQTRVSGWRGLPVSIQTQVIGLVFENLRIFLFITPPFRHRQHAVRVAAQGRVRRRKVLYRNLRIRRCESRRQDDGPASRSQVVCCKSGKEGRIG
jgi:hypothetical protein